MGRRASEVIVRTADGQLRGMGEDRVVAFKGIPYGGPTGDVNRFMPPTPVEPWAGVRNAFEFGPLAPQPTGLGLTDMRLIKRDDLAALVYGAAHEDIPIGEDCLVLNVWTPGADDARRPVMVWIHGGAFIVGSGSIPMYRGDRLAARGDVVVVTLNHRLGIMGYLHLGEIAGERYANSGNAGMLDLIAALQWVRDNIAVFGGDPDNVTIFGQSGGGLKVSLLMAMPAATGLFHRAVIQSGPAVEAKTAEDATSIARSALAKLGVPEGNPDALATLPLERLLKAQAAELVPPCGAGRMFGHRSSRPWQRGPRWFEPIIDGASLLGHPFEPTAPAQSASVPVLIGTTKDEHTLSCYGHPRFGTLKQPELRQMAEAMFGDDAEAVLAAYAHTRPDATPTDLMVAFTTDGMWSDSIKLAERQSADASAPVFMYLFTYETPVLGGVLKSAHGLDIPFVFHTLDRYPLVGDRPDRFEFCDRVCDAWLSFARTGDPNHTGLPTWPAYTADTRTTMILDAEPRTIEDPMGELRELWLKERLTLEHKPENATGEGTQHGAALSEPSASSL